MRTGERTVHGAAAAELAERYCPTKRVYADWCRAVGHAEHVCTRAPGHTGPHISVRHSGHYQPGQEHVVDQWFGEAD